MRLAPAALLLGALPLLAQEAETLPLRVLRTGGLRVETAALLMSGQEGGTIPIAVLAVPLPGSAERSRVAVLLELDGAEAMAGQQGDLLRLEVCLYAVLTAAEGAGGRVAGSRMDTVEVDLARVGPDLERSGIKYIGELELPPGSYALRALVRNAATGEVGLRSLPLSVPDFGRRQGLLLPPLFPEPAGAWLLARGAGIASPPPVFTFDALPSARPILAPSGTAALRLPAWRLGETELQAEVRRPGGARVATFPLTVSGREETGTPGLEVLAASLEPRGLEEGVYEVRAIPGGDADAAVLSTPFVLLERGSDGQVWAALTPSRRGQAEAGGGVSSPPPAAAPRGKRTRKIDAGPVREAYRKALAHLAGGDREAGRAAVLELETSVLGGERPASSADLQDVELAVAKELSRGDAEALIPILTLHQVLYRDAVRKQVFLVSTHERELVLRLAGLYAERNGAPDGRKKAARFVTALASEMIWNAPPTLRARLFRQILAFDESDGTALLCLAVDAERQGRYAEASGFLEHLLRVQPGSAEARLRLAVNQARLGKTQEARKLLREVSTRNVAEPWQVAVAGQELARLLLADGDLDGAEAAIREALQRLPDDDKLALELALVRDLRKDPRGARDAVAKLGARNARGAPAGGGGGAARHRYNQMPLEQLDQAWAELQQAALDRLAVLAAALGVPGPEAPRNTP
jgi:Flp pilus assembly protein TadD